jgi:hypothetical protein
MVAAIASPATVAAVVVLALVAVVSVVAAAVAVVDAKRNTNEKGKGRHKPAFFAFQM